MAETFLTRVNDLTSLGLTDGIDQFLTDGATDIINKIIAIKPSLAPLFAKETVSTIQDSTCDYDKNSTAVSMDDTSLILVGMNVTGDRIEDNTTVAEVTNDTDIVLSQATANEGGAVVDAKLSFWTPYIDVKNAQVLEASLGYGEGLVEDFESTNWDNDAEWTATDYPATRISISEARKAIDPSNMAYRSRFNPGYYVKDGKVFSIPLSTQDINFKVMHIHYPSIAKDETANSTSLQYFSSQYIYLIPIYAAMKALNETLALIEVDEMGATPGSPSKVFDEFLQTDDDSELATVQAHRLQHEVTAKNAEYQWMVEQYTRLKAEYNEAFAVLRPPTKATA